MRAAMMNTTMSGQHERCAWAIARSRKLRNAFENGIIKIEEYAQNLADSAVAACDDCMHSLVDDIPGPLVVSLFDSLKQFLEPVDFMPYPGPFIPGVASQEEIDRTKCQLRNKYIFIYKIIMNRVTAMGGQDTGAEHSESRPSSRRAAHT